MTHTDLLSKIMLLPPEEIEKEAHKLNDYAACWNAALTFALDVKEPDFPNWYAEHEKELH